MPKRLKRCKECKQYTISPTKCPFCGGELESVYPPKFSLEDKYQKYRMDFFKEKMSRLFGITPADSER